jgi:uncharacterized membrane protein YdjX (TVP38/TMEM64 family)
MNIGSYIACAAGGALLGANWGTEGAVLGAITGFIVVRMAREVDEHFRKGKE